MGESTANKNVDTLRKFINNTINIHLNKMDI